MSSSSASMATGFILADATCLAHATTDHVHGHPCPHATFMFMLVLIFSGQLSVSLPCSCSCPPQCSCPCCISTSLPSCQDAKVAHIAVDAFWDEWFRAGDLDSAQAAAKCVIRMAASALLQCDSDDSRALQKQSLRGYNSANGQLALTHKGKLYYLGKYSDENAARVSARHWHLRLLDGMDPSDVRLECIERASNEEASDTPTADAALLLCSSADGMEMEPRASNEEASNTPTADPALLLCSSAEGMEMAPHMEMNTAPLSCECAEMEHDVHMNSTGALQILSWISKKMPGGILGDNMGCGKTLTTIMVASHGHEDGTTINVHNPMIVVVPSKLVPFWARETVKWKPNLRVVKTPEYCSSEELPTREEWRNADVVVGGSFTPPLGAKTTRGDSKLCWPPSCWLRILPYEAFWRYDIMEEIFNCNVRVVAFDEVKGFEDPESRTAKMLREWRTHTPELFVLPIAGTLFSASVRNAANFLQCVGFAEVQPTCESIQDVLGTCLLRRREPRQWATEFTQVLLPPRPSQIASYRHALNALSPFGSSAFCAPYLLRVCAHALTTSMTRPFSEMSLSELLDGSSKLRWLLRFLRDTLAADDTRIVIYADAANSRRLLYEFFAFVTLNRGNDDKRDSCLKGLESLISAPIYTISGSTTSFEANEMLKSFEAGDCKVLVASMLSGGRGHNLPHVTHVVNWDVASSVRSWWQGLYRALRPPRSESAMLHVYDLIMKNTIEEGQHYARWARHALSEAILPKGAQLVDDNEEDVHRPDKVRFLDR